MVEIREKEIWKYNRWRKTTVRGDGKKAGSWRNSMKTEFGGRGIPGPHLGRPTSCTFPPPMKTGHWRFATNRRCRMADIKN